MKTFNTLTSNLSIMQNRIYHIQTTIEQELLMSPNDLFKPHVTKNVHNNTNMVNQDLHSPSAL